jgi:two-component system chemotaxis response regulator CheY
MARYTLLAAFFFIQPMEINMRTLIVEDDYTSQIILENALKSFSSCDAVTNGVEAVAGFRRALDEARPYDLICMDIMMPELNGQDALRQIRHIEKTMDVPAADEVKVVMTTALSETRQVADALFKGGASAYFVKPIHIDHFLKELKALDLIQN